MGNTYQCCKKDITVNDIHKLDAPTNFYLQENSPPKYIAASQILINFEKFDTAYKSSIEMAMSDDNLDESFLKEQMFKENHRIMLKKYKKLAQIANVFGDFDDFQKLVETPLEGAIPLCKGVYDKENDLKFEVNIKEHVINGIRHHELSQNWQTKGLTIEDHTYSDMLMQKEDLNKFDDKIDRQYPLFFWEEGDVFYYVLRIVIKKNFFIPGHEVIIFVGCKNLPDGRHIQFFKSIDHPDYPIGNNNLQRIDIKKGAYLFEPFKKEGCDDNFQNVRSYQFMDPCISINFKVIRSFMAKYHKKVFMSKYAAVKDFKNRNKNLRELIENFKFVK